MNSKDYAVFKPEFSYESSDVKSCRICLDTSDVKMHDLTVDKNLQQCLDSILRNKPFQGLPKYVCYECAANVVKCYKLMEKLRISDETFGDIYTENGLITEELIEDHRKPKKKLFSRLDSYLLLNYSYIYYDEDGKSSGLAGTSADCTEMSDIKPKIEIKNETLGPDSIESDTRKIKVEKTTLKRKMEHNELYDMNDTNFTNNKRMLNDTSNKNIMFFNPYGVEVGKLSPEQKKAKMQKCMELMGKKKQYMSPQEMAIRKNFSVIEISSLPNQIKEWKKDVAEQLVRDEVSIICDTCHKIFTDVNMHRIHILEHNQIRDKHRCPVCLLRFSSKEVVKLHHLRIHTKKYQCKSCKRTFVTTSEAENHMIVCYVKAHDASVTPVSNYYPTNNPVPGYQAQFFPPSHAFGGQQYWHN